ncbi:MAG: CPBP family intramembrane metalloprotease [Opitutales bacterium]|nr:CPBP family intramembrane metalloprotease [Opitutales bacterium]
MKGMQDSPVFSVLMFAASLYVFRLWVSDMRASPKPKNAFAGSEPAGVGLVALSAFIGIMLAAAYSVFEDLLGVGAEQTSVAVWAVFYWAGSAFIEELIFRGYLCVQNRGRGVLIFSCAAFSTIFALAHPFLWDFSADGGFVFKTGLSAWFNTFCVFANSAIFYFLRFAPFNRNRSLLPCFAAHLAYNLGVFAAKALRGFVLL